MTKCWPPREYHRSVMTPFSLNCFEFLRVQFCCGKSISEKTIFSQNISHIISAHHWLNLTIYRSCPVNISETTSCLKTTANLPCFGKTRQKDKRDCLVQSGRSKDITETIIIASSRINQHQTYMLPNKKKSLGLQDTQI